jgi:hypothetical protein
VESSRKAWEASTFIGLLLSVVTPPTRWLQSHYLRSSLFIICLVQMPWVSTPLPLILPHFRISHLIPHTSCRQIRNPVTHAVLRNDVYLPPPSIRPHDLAFRSGPAFCCRKLFSPSKAAARLLQFNPNVLSEAQQESSSRLPLWAGRSRCYIAQFTSYGRRALQAVNANPSLVLEPALALLVCRIPLQG